MLVVGRSEGHFTYYLSIIRALIEAEAAVTLWYVEGWTDGNNAALRDFRRAYPSLDLAWVPPRRDWPRRGVFGLRELRSYAWYLRRPDASAFYVDRWRSYLSGWARRIAGSGPGRWVLRRPAVDWLFEVLEKLVRASPDAVTRLRRLAPDVVVASPSNMRFSEEIEYVKAARRLKLPVAVLVQTWDSLTTKGYLHVVPDVLLAWHGQHRAAARDLHGVATERVRVIGAPFFDKWLEPFADGSAAGGGAPYILYLGSSRNIAADEVWVVTGLKRALEGHWHPAMRRVEVRARAHPANRKPFRALDREGVEGIRVVATALPQNQADGGEFRRLAAGALAVVGINTSGMIDAVVLDRPTVAVRLDEYRQTQAMAPHFQAMVDSGAMYVESSFEAVADRALALWRGEDRGADGRRVFRQRMIWPAGTGRSAGSEATRAIAELLRRGPAAGSGRRLPRSGALQAV